MTRSPLRLVGLLTLAALVGACHAKGPSAVLTVSTPGATGTLQPRATLDARTLVEGTFTLPPQLVSVGGAQLVSVGGAQLVSVGAGQFHVQNFSAWRGVAGAPVRLAPGSHGAPIFEAVTDATGGYAIAGAAAPGVYRVEAGPAEAPFLTLAVLGGSGPVSAPLCVGTTLVAAQFLAAAGDGLAVLPLEGYDAAVDAVEAALQDADVPPGWTPRSALATLAMLSARDPAVAQAMARLLSESARLDERVRALSYQLEGLGSTLGLSRSEVAARVGSVLSKDPAASDEAVSRDVSATPPKHAAPPPPSAASEAPAATPEPSEAPATVAPSPTATPRPHHHHHHHHGRGKPPVSDEGPEATPSASPEPTPVDEPPATPAEEPPAIEDPPATEPGEDPVATGPKGDDHGLHCGQDGASEDCPEQAGR